MAHRPWSELQELALLVILRRLPSLLDLFAFAGVCRSWRSLLRSSAALLYLSSRPPLLLRPPRHLHRRQARPLLTADGCDGFSLHALDDLHTPYRSLFPLSSAVELCLAYSHDYLILLHGRARSDPVLADVLTGAEILLPALPLVGVLFYYGTLTAPPASSSSTPSSPSCAIG
ncbi:hypothetical protein MUK42_05610 [Musa troglodytarum]|uniref:F-box domain-containing protein n=1 Tax=Musa troglodytarum TaxID=320322 RepID=A0A9E7EMK4_9LILI|nr:hypothetical protein MUK42_05610 [Musa troglodytarum]